jgi:hypothetical protein
MQTWERNHKGGKQWNADEHGAGGWRGLGLTGDTEPNKIEIANTATSNEC